MSNKMAFRCVQPNPFKKKCDTCHFYDEGCKAPQDIYWDHEKQRFIRWIPS